MALAQGPPGRQQLEMDEQRAGGWGMAETPSPFSLRTSQDLFMEASLGSLTAWRFQGSPSSGPLPQ